jgi:hypothetical protein
VDTETGQVRRGRVQPACRERLREFLGRFAGRDDVEFVVEACTGWRFIVEEVERAGFGAHLAEPAETAAARGPKRRAKTDGTDIRGPAPTGELDDGHMADDRPSWRPDDVCAGHVRHQLSDGPSTVCNTVAVGWSSALR